MKRKKFLVLCLVLVVATTSAFASIFQLGVSTSLPMPISFENPDLMGEQFKKIENYSFGADVRINVPFSNVVGLSFGLPTMMSFGGDRIVAMDSTILADLVLAPKSMLSLQAGLGYKIGFGWDKGGTFYHSFSGDFTKNPMIYHAGISLDLFGFGLNVSYLLPCMAIDNWKPNAEAGKLVCSFYLLSI